MIQHYQQNNQNGTSGSINDFWVRWQQWLPIICAVLQDGGNVPGL
jgi:hypothetical protein